MWMMLSGEDMKCLLCEQKCQQQQDVSRKRYLSSGAKGTTQITDSSKTIPIYQTIMHKLKLL
jgi:hypothetical protein